jgi:putative membrane protein
MEQEKHPIRGILAGVAGGLVAAWAMNIFSAGPGKKLDQAVEPEDYLKQQEQSANEPRQDATMKAADLITEEVTGGRHLTWEQQEKGGPIVHYAFGALMGGVYGGLAEYSSVARSGGGATFGAVLFGTADLLAVPALNLSGSPSDSPAQSLITPFATHLVYGITTELVRKVVRLVL